MCTHFLLKEMMKTVVLFTCQLNLKEKTTANPRYRQRPCSLSTWLVSTQVRQLLSRVKSRTGKETFTLQKRCQTKATLQLDSVHFEPSPHRKLVKAFWARLTKHETRHSKPQCSQQQVKWKQDLQWIGYQSTSDSARTHQTKTCCRPWPHEKDISGDRKRPTTRILLCSAFCAQKKNDLEVPFWSVPLGCRCGPNLSITLGAAKSNQTTGGLDVYTLQIVSFSTTLRREEKPRSCFNRNGYAFSAQN